jgi:hypothetical protein
MKYERIKKEMRSKPKGADRGEDVEKDTKTMRIQNELEVFDKKRSEKKFTQRKSTERVLSILCLFFKNFMH